MDERWWLRGRVGSRGGVVGAGDEDVRERSPEPRKNLEVDFC